MLIDDMLITMRRLVDPKESTVKGGKRDNLSLRYLESRIDDSNLRKDLSQLIGQILKTTEAPSLICSRRVAHSDLLHKLDLESLPPLNMKSIDEALCSIESVLNAVYFHWGGHPIVYSMAGLTLRGNGVHLLNRLRQAEYYCQQLQDLEASLSQETTIAFGAHENDPSV